MALGKQFTRYQLEDFAEQAHSPLPDWLSAPKPELPIPHPDPKSEANLERLRLVKEATVADYEIAFPVVIEMMMGGHFYDRAIEERFPHIRPGGWMAWVKRDPVKHAEFNFAKEVRSEGWVGKVIRHGEGTESPMDDVQRSTLAVSGYKWAIENENRKGYGKTTTIEIGGTISITRVLEQAQSRVLSMVDDISDAQLIEKDD